MTFPGENSSSDSNRAGVIDGDERGTASDSLQRLRGHLVEWMQLSEAIAPPEVSNCTQLIVDLLEIAECSGAEAGESRSSQVAAMIEFAQSAWATLQAAVNDQSAGSDSIVQIQSEARRRWGEYLGLMRRDDPWNELLTTPGQDPACPTVVEASQEAGRPEQDLKLILSALADSSRVTRDAHRGADSSPAKNAGRAATTPAAPPTPPNPTHFEIDDALLAAYLEDTQRCLASMEHCLLTFEANPADTASLKQFCRELHTLKGASASVGLADLGRYLHDLEDFVQWVATSDRASTDIEPMLKGVDAVRAQVTAFVNPKQRARPGETAPAIRSEDSQPQTVTGTVAVAPLSLVSNTTPTLRDETVRVEAARLDRLMDVMAELVISRNRRDTQVGQLKQLYTELTRSVGRLRMFGDSMSLDRPDCTADATRDERLPSAADPHDMNNATPQRSNLWSEMVNDVSEIARTLRELYEPVAAENLAASRLMGQLRHELMELRRQPISGLLLRLQRAARDAAHAEGKQIQLIVRGEHAGLEPSLQERLYEPLLHLVRNAVSHGIESAADRAAAGKPAVGAVKLEARADPTSLVIEVSDDGNGLNYDAIHRRALELGLLKPEQPVSHRLLAQLIFRPGFSTRDKATEVAGRGVGMDIVANVVDRLRGQIEVESTPGQGTAVRLRIPLRSSIEHTMVFRVAGQLFALPMQFVEAAQPTGSPQGTVVGPAARSPSAPLPSVRLRDLLVPSGSSPPPEEHVLVISHGGPGLTRSGSHAPAHDRIALIVDAVIGPEEVVIRSLPPLFKSHRLLAGVTLSGAGEIVLLFDGAELIARAFRQSAIHERTPTDRMVEDERKAGPLKILVVDDSLSARRSLSRMLERRGFSVTEASDGLEALELLRTRTFSLLLTDLEMPRMGGLELLAEIRRNRRVRSMPVAVVSSITNPEIHNRAKQLEALDFVVKPITDASLNEILDGIGCTPRST